MQKCDHGSHLYGTIGTQERVLISQGIRAISVRDIEVLRYTDILYTVRAIEVLLCTVILYIVRAI